MVAFTSVSAGDISDRIRTIKPILSNSVVNYKRDSGEQMLMA
jgi:hypothetical protein